MCDKLLSIRENFLKSVFDQTMTNSIEMLKIRNNNGLTAFHVATENGYYQIVERMLKAVSTQKKLIEECDQQLRTSLHIAALKGNVQIQ